MRIPSTSAGKVSSWGKVRITWLRNDVIVLLRRFIYESICFFQKAAVITCNKHVPALAITDVTDVTDRHAK